MVVVEPSAARRQTQPVGRRMKSVWLENGIVTVQDVPEPQREKGHALLRLIIAGICNTDLELQRGYYGFSGVPGHEFVAEVVEADDQGWVGQRVAGEINLACGHCDWCRRDLGRHCPNRTVLGIVKHPGAFAEYFTLPEVNLRRVPPNVSTDRAVFTEPVAAACEILEQVAIPSGSEVAVLGDGKLGLLIAQVLAANDLDVHLFGRHPDKMRIAARAGVTVDSGRTQFRFVVDATGSSEGLAQAVRLTEPRGTLIMKSTVSRDVTVDTAAIIVNELTLVGSRCGRFDPALDLISAGKLHLDEMISGRYALADAPEAFAHAATRGTLKILLEP